MQNVNKNAQNHLLLTFLIYVKMMVCSCSTTLVLVFLYSSSRTKMKYERQACWGPVSGADDGRLDFSVFHCSRCEATSRGSCGMMCLVAFCYKLVLYDLVAGLENEMVVRWAMLRIQYLVIPWRALEQYFAYITQKLCVVYCGNFIYHRVCFQYPSKYSEQTWSFHHCRLFSI